MRRRAEALALLVGDTRRLPLCPAYTPHNAKYSDKVLLLAGGDKVISKPVDFGALNAAAHTALSFAGRQASLIHVTRGAARFAAMASSAHRRLSDSNRCSFGGRRIDVRMSAPGL
jgi:hypothetical protein